jgi:hypothetical protein
MFVFYSLDSDEEKALNQNNLTIDPVKSHKKRKKQKDKSKVTFCVQSLINCFYISFNKWYLNYRNLKSQKK